MAAAATAGAAVAGLSMNPIFNTKIPIVILRTKEWVLAPALRNARSAQIRRPPGKAPEAAGGTWRVGRKTNFV